MHMKTRGKGAAGRQAVRQTGTIAGMQSASRRALLQTDKQTSTTCAAMQASQSLGLMAGRLAGWFVALLAGRLVRWLLG